jgi:hypothetical protein
VFSSPTPNKRARRKRVLPKLPERLKTVIREIPGTEEIDLSHSAGSLIVRLHLRSRSVVVHEKRLRLLSTAASEETLHNVTHSLSQSSLAVSTRSVIDYEPINPVFPWIDHSKESTNPALLKHDHPNEPINPIFPRVDHPKEITNPILSKVVHQKEPINPVVSKLDEQNEPKSELILKTSLLVKQRSIEKVKSDSSDFPSDSPKSTLKKTPSYKSSMLAVKSKSMYLEPCKSSVSLKMVHSSTQVNFPMKCIFSRSESPETRPVERAIEARTGSEDGLGSMVRCLHFAHTYIANRKLNTSL